MCAAGARADSSLRETRDQVLDDRRSHHQRSREGRGPRGGEALEPGLHRVAKCLFVAGYGRDIQQIRGRKFADQGDGVGAEVGEGVALDPGVVGCHQHRERALSGKHVALELVLGCLEVRERTSDLRYEGHVRDVGGHDDDVCLERHG